MTAGFAGNPEHFIEEDAALVWASQIPAGQVLTDDRFSIVIVGRPRWKTAALQETARTNGHARALKQAFLENGLASPQRAAAPYATRRTAVYGSSEPQPSKAVIVSGAGRSAGSKSVPRV